MKRANVLMAAGAALLILGVALVWILGRDDDGGGKEAEVAVLVARADLTAGESGDELVAGGKVAVEQVPASEAVDGALASSAPLSGTILATDVAEGEQVLATSTRPANLRSGSITIPKDKQAIALTLDFTGAVAGYTGAGDRVNVYVNVAPGTEGAPQAPYTKLLLSDVEVLDVSSEIAPNRSTASTAAGTDPDATGNATAGARAGASQLTLLLALDATQAEQAIFAASQNSLWFTLLPKGQEPSETGGVDYQTNYLGEP